MEKIYFQYWLHHSGKFNFRIRDTASNHNLTATRQGYENEADCISTMRLINPRAEIIKVDAP